MKKINVLYVIGQLSNGGQERQLTYLLDSIDKNNISPFVFVWNLDESEVNYKSILCKNITIFSSNRSTSGIGKILLLRKLCHTYKIDILHSYSFYLNVAVWIASIVSTVKSIGALRTMLSVSVTEHGIFMGTLNALFPPNIIVNNYSGGQQMIKKLGWLKRNTIHIITNKIDLKLFVSEERLPIGEDFIIASVSSIIQLKRLDILVEVIRKLKAKGYKVKSFHAGDGQERGKILELIRLYNLKKEIIMLGEINNTKDLLSCCDLFVHTSDAEGTPNVIMEALASGRPVVATDCGDVRYLIKNGETGFIVPSGDVTMLVERIVFLIENPDQRIRMALKAREFAERNFDMSLLYKENYSLYRDLLTRCS